MLKPVISVVIESFTLMKLSWPKRTLAAILESIFNILKLQKVQQLQSLYFNQIYVLKR